MFKVLSVFSFIVALNSCILVPEYSKTFLNDDEMDIGLSDTESLSNNSKTYREGSQGANGGKNGGGCGCN